MTIEEEGPELGTSSAHGYEIMASVLRHKGDRFRSEKVFADSLRSDEVLVRIVATGLCHTDISVQHQLLPVRLPAVLGHEGAGIVQEIGAAVTKVKVGDPVVLSFGSCGACSNCRRSQYSCCSRFGMLNFSGVRGNDGQSPYRDAEGQPVSGLFFGQSSFASHSLTNERNVVRVPATVPLEKLELLGPLGCGFQTGAGTVMNALKPRPGSSIAVFGVGSVGLAAVMAARVVGCTTIIAIDLHRARLDMAAELGATHLVNATDIDVTKKIQEIAPEGVQFSIDCSGVPAVVRQAVESLRSNGICALVGVAARGTDLVLPMGLLSGGRTVMGVVEGNSIAEVFIPELIELWQQGRFPFDRLIRKYPMSQLNEAIDATSSGEVFKAILFNETVKSTDV
jgi:aryl-alcohol dehydrogenase